MNEQPKTKIKKDKIDWENVVKVDPAHRATDNVWRRAKVVAEYLFEKNKWDGETVIVIKNPIRVHANIELFSYSTPKEGEDYYFDKP